jgi:GT2 family glycosyltransferase/glycosyltransferase involved in cell wall biosynthesis
MAARLKVLEIVHGFPPAAHGGAETYAWTHACALHAGGDEVVIFTREADAARPEYAVREETSHGLRVVRVNNTFRASRNFEDTYRNAAIGAIARQLIDDWRPDVAHIHHLTCLSTTIPETLAERGIPAFYTLHDYWLMCHRGQLLDTAYRVCDGPCESGACHACLGTASGMPASAFSAASAVRQLERRLPAALSAPLGRASRRIAGGIATSGAMEREALARTEHMRRVCAAMTHFLAPSAHMRDRFVKFGLPSDRITVSGYGFDHRPFRHVEPTTSSQLRIGFLGSLMVSKAPHVLLEAFHRLPSGAASVTLFGEHVDYHGDTSYRETLAPLLQQPGVKTAGPIAHTDVPRALSGIDVLVVPSIWPENSPLVIREAFLAGVPVIASRIGGIVELIQDGVGGLLFGPGDVDDLHRVLQRCLDEPELLPALRAGIPPVRTIEDDVQQTRAMYEAALASKPMRTGTSSRIAAVVLNYQTPDDTRLAVGSLLASRRALDDIIVIDNGDGGDCARALGDFGPAVSVISAGGNLGFSGGMNLGIREALRRGAGAVLLVNSDAVLPPDCVGILERSLREGERRGIVGPILRSRADPGLVESAGMTYNPRTGRMRHRAAGERGDSVQGVQTGVPDGVSGCVMLIGREVFEAIGLLDESYFFSFEDLDFCLRARAAGYATAIAPAATAYHEGSRSVGVESPRRLYYAARNHLMLASRPSGARRTFSKSRLAYVVTLNLAHALRANGASPIGRVAAVLHGVRDYLAGRKGAHGP